MYATATIADGPIIEHELSIRFDEAARAFDVTDHVMTVDGATGNPAELPDLVLAPALAVTRVVVDGREVGDVPRGADGVIPIPAGSRSAIIDYRGNADPDSWPHVSLGPADAWHALAPGYRHRFSVRVDAPANWVVLTQGRLRDQHGEEGGAWIGSDPQQGIHLVAGPWNRYRRDEGGPHADVWLLRDDPPLAHTWLEASLDWLAVYGEAIGPYPYHRFTVVENPRQTGYGMPAFTLLGSRVMRLPFIIATSLPHEVLHNWWGNGVLVDDARGNWSEALTTYLADHLVAERRGEGRRYRLDTLLSWHDFAAGGGDLPLSGFAGHRDRAARSVGYGKGMFLFHMLRGRLGDEVFLDGLRRLYDGFLFRRAGFDDVRGAFEAACACALGALFDQWLDRTGAPDLAIDGAVRELGDSGHTVRFDIVQANTPPWRLRVPVRVIDAAGHVSREVLDVTEARQSFSVYLEAAAARIDVDPDFDLFRRLDGGERPVTFGRVFGAADVAVSASDDTMQAAAREAAARHGWRVDDTGDAAVVVLLGREHPLAPRWLRGDDASYRVTEEGVAIDGEFYPASSNVVVTLVDAVEVAGKPRVVLWVASDDPGETVNTVARLAHYGRASYAVFTPDGAPGSARSGQWPGRSSTLTRVFDDTVRPRGEMSARPLF